MIEPGRFALNRITVRHWGWRSSSGFRRISGLQRSSSEMISTGRDIIDGLSPSKAAALAERHGVRIITINALQKFNLKAVRAKAAEELEKLLDLAAAIRCPAIVLCPNNDTRDSRDAVTRVAETVEALKAFGPSFMKRGMQGYRGAAGVSRILALLASSWPWRRRGAPDSRAIASSTIHSTTSLGLTRKRTSGLSTTFPSTGLIHVSGVESGNPQGEVPG